MPSCKDPLKLLRDGCLAEEIPARLAAPASGAGRRMSSKAPLRGIELRKHLANLAARLRRAREDAQRSLAASLR